MREAVKQYIQRLNESDLSVEFKALNTLQETPWKINRPVLDVMRASWEGDGTTVGLSAKVDLPLEPYPFEAAPRNLTESQKEEFKAWKGRVAVIHQENHSSMTRRIQVERTLQVAEKYVKYDEFYFVWQNDFRGRKYALGAFLSPQSADFSKSLITFANGMEIKTEDDADWLAIHGANLFGADKISLTDRILWAYLNSPKALEVAEDPYNNKWWQEADKPWQFLAWCLEFAGYLKQGVGFITHLPCQADGSNNGLQHLSAILRDYKGGESVNLVPSEIPKDIYTDVANRTIAALEIEAAKGDELAQKLLDFGIDRKLTKRSVMIVPYSGTKRACNEYIADAIQEKIDAGYELDVVGVFATAMYLANFVWDAIQEVISSASVVMDYLREAGSLCASENKPMQWYTPTGFLVSQDYPNVSKKRIKTYLDGQIIALRVNQYKEATIDKRRAKNGASPNFIHSLDAAALTLTVNKGVDEGIKDYAMIHDSYGTHSPNMPLLSQILREEFVRMYTENDVLLSLKNDIESYTEGVLETPPNTGSLDLSQVIQSKYFFA